MIDLRNTKAISPLIGKAISAVVETPGMEEYGEIIIQFSDGSELHIDAVPTKDGAKLFAAAHIPKGGELVQSPRQVHGQVHGQVKWKGSSAKDNAPFNFVASTEDGNPVEDLDLQDYDDETLTKMGR